MNLKIIDNFYDEKDFNFMIKETMLNTYKVCWQPNEQKFNNRANAYACYETNVFIELDTPYKLFFKTFQEKTGFIIETLNTFFRKIYSSELGHIFKYGLRPHKDSVEHDVAGIIHFNTFSLNDGTGIFSEFENNNYQIEPDVIVGAKPNRCVFYESQIWHRPLQDKNTEMRIVQPFFIKFK
jgi:hypothetical protein